MNGWIKLNKRIRKHWLWDHPDYFRAWVDMLMMANWRETKKLYKDEIVVLKRGEFPMSFRALQERWGMSMNKTKRFISLLKKDTMIDTHTDYGYTVVKIINFEKFQAKSDTQVDTVKDTLEDTGEDTLRDTTRRIYKNNKNIKDTPYSPPSGDSFAIQFFKLWIKPNEANEQPTAYEKKDIVQIAKKYNGDIEFWKPLLIERRKRIGRGDFIHTSLKAFCGGGFRDYTSKKTTYTKLATGLWKAYCTKCGKKNLPNDYQLKQNTSCCGVEYTPKKPNIVNTSKADKKVMDALGVNL